MYKQLSQYSNLFINTENWKLYMVKDGQMVEVNDGEVIIYRYSR